MKVILLQDIRGVGKRYDIKDVRDGYAINFLIAKKFAIQATPHEIARRDAQKYEEQDEIRRLQQQAERMKKEILSFTLKTGARGEVFNSVTKDSIIKMLAEKGSEGIKEIVLEKPIRARGTHTVTVRLKHGIPTVITIETY